MAEQDENERLADIKAVNEALARRQMAKIQAMSRLNALAAAAGDHIDRELDRLRGYLQDWAVSQLGYRGYQQTGGSCLADYMKSSSPTMTELLERSDNWAMSVIDACIDDLTELPDGMMMRAALRVRWLNEGVSREVGMPISVFRSGRLQPMSIERVDALADLAERAMVPVAKRRGLPL